MTTGPAPLFRVVLVQPEIPNNTGNIGRTCVATGCALHLVRPLGFDTSEKACRRAGLDYWPRLGVREHDSLDEFLTTHAASPDRLWLFSTHARRVYFDAPFRPGDALIFGSETRGLGPAVLDRFPERALVMPMVPGERSLNLATAVCAVVYEGVRRCVAQGTVGVDTNGRLIMPVSGETVREV